MTSKLIGKYVIARTYSAGVFAGTLEERSEDGKQVRLTGARRLWYWAGAASLSQLSLDGVSKPDECKFPAVVDLVELSECIELLPVTEAAQASIAAVPVWSK
jgi:hypothetical protein